MITSIDKLENLGIYNKIPPKRCQDFKRYNLIYGWNGSGKSTLSRLFDLLGDKKHLMILAMLRQQLLVMELHTINSNFRLQVKKY